MDHSLIGLRGLLVAAGIALAVAPAAQAQPLADEYAGVFWSPMFARGLGPGPGSPTPPGALRPGRGGDAPWSQHGFDGPEGQLPAPPILRGLSLTETQRDQVFAILHAQAPLLREKAKAARRAQDELRAMTISTQYDKAKAKLLADAGARAFGELALLRADGEHQIYMALTDDQREQLEAMRRVSPTARTERLP
jgi:Spy/CpxP family protein refolding chaperone